MSAPALALILAAAIVHASWNYLLKKSGGGVGFVWLFAAFSALFYLPLAGIVAWHAAFVPDATQLGFMALSAILHTAYFLTLDRGYRRGDLSLVYPLARAVGPLITVAVAVAWLGERPTAVGLAGALTIVTGAFLLAGNPRRVLRAGDAHAVGYALITGMLIAGYSVADKQAVAAFAVPPLILDWASNLGRVAVMIPLAWRERASVSQAWRSQRRAVFAVALLCPLSYIMVLSAMVFTPVSYVAPARELSILVAAFLGTRLLAERDASRRLTAAALMVGGVLLLAAA